jgi:hypothetical protein
MVPATSTATTIEIRRMTQSFLDLIALDEFFGPQARAFAGWKHRAARSWSRPQHHHCH